MLRYKSYQKVTFLFLTAVPILLFFSRQDDGDRHESKKDKKKDKRKRDKTPNRFDGAAAAMKSGFVKPGGKEYYFKVGLVVIWPW